MKLPLRDCAAPEQVRQAIMRSLYHCRAFMAMHTVSVRESV
jgi:hypothetical protein